MLIGGRRVAQLPFSRPNLDGKFNKKNWYKMKMIFKLCRPNGNRCRITAHHVIHWFLNILRLFTR